MERELKSNGREEEEDEEEEEEVALDVEGERESPTLVAALTGLAVMD